MKKLILLAPVLLFTLTGCGTQTGTINCTLSSKDVVNGYELNSVYKINYTGDYVDTVETIEIVTSDSDIILNTFETTLNDSYGATSEAYGGYTYEVTKQDGKITSDVKIDYSKMDVEQFIEDQPTLKSYVKNGKFLIEGIKGLYESMGATCE